MTTCMKAQVENAINITEHMKKEIENGNYGYAAVLNKTIVELLEYIIEHKDD